MAATMAGKRRRRRRRDASSSDAAADGSIGALEADLDELSVSVLGGIHQIMEKLNLN